MTNINLSLYCDVLLFFLTVDRRLFGGDENLADKSACS